MANPVPRETDIPIGSVLDPADGFRYRAPVIGEATEGQLLAWSDAEDAYIPVSGTQSTVQVEQALSTASFIDQNPPGLGVEVQVLFGDPSESTPFFQVSGDGTITCLIADEYTFRLRFGIGREGGAGESQIYIRALINGTPVGNSVVAIIDNNRIEIPATFEGVLNLEVNDTITLEMIRDTDGNNSGGLRAGIPDVAGWASSPSALMTVTRFVAVT